MGINLNPRNLNQFKTPPTVDGRVCTKCLEFKGWDKFNTAAKSHTGKQAECRTCKNGRVRINRDIIKEKFSAKQHKARLKKTNPHLVRGRNIRSSLMTRAKKLEMDRTSIPTAQEIADWLKDQEPLTCYYTGVPVTLFKMHVDHKVPPYRGGTHTLDNLCVTDSKINSAKGQMTEEEFKSLLGLVGTWEDKGYRLLIRLRQGFM